MLPRSWLSISLCMSGIVVACHRTLASYSASSARSVRLRPPVAVGSGNVLAVTSRDDKTSATSSYEVVRETGASFDGLQVCVWIDSATATDAGRPARSGPFCFEEPQNDLPIRGLGLGSHRLSAAVAAPGVKHVGQKKTPVLLSPIAIADFEVVLREEFVPTYRWQEVRSWQSVPPGLDVQLPLDGVSQKRARIPPAWRLQLYVEGGEEEGKAGGNGFFLRTDLRADDAVLNLRQEIARHPRFGRPLGCVKLALDGRVLGDGETMEGLDLFNRQRDIIPVVDRSTVQCGSGA